MTLLNPVQVAEAITESLTQLADSPEFDTSFIAESCATVSPDVYGQYRERVNMFSKESNVTQERDIELNAISSATASASESIWAAVRDLPEVQAIIMQHAETAAAERDTEIAAITRDATPPVNMTAATAFHIS